MKNLFLAFLGSSPSDSSEMAPGSSTFVFLDLGVQLSYSPISSAFTWSVFSSLRPAFTPLFSMRSCASLDSFVMLSLSMGWEPCLRLDFDSALISSLGAVPAAAAVTSFLLRSPLFCVASVAAGAAPLLTSAAWWLEGWDWLWRPLAASACNRSAPVDCCCASCALESEKEFCGRELFPNLESKPCCCC